MPFFCSISKKIKHIGVTLQVRILNNPVYHILYRYYGKKAFLSVPGSLTLEAVMCLTLFIFAAVCLILPMKIMTGKKPPERDLLEGPECGGTNSGMAALRSWEWAARNWKRAVFM